MRRRLPESPARRKLAWLMTERRLAELERARRAEWDEEQAVLTALMAEES